MSTHTPGPWKVDGPSIVAQADTGPVIVGLCASHEANAQLMAAAPQMLAENERLKARLRYIDDNRSDGTAVEFAIKATDEEWDTREEA